MMTLLDFLDVIGRATWQPVWIPLFAWTALALPLWVFLERTDRLHPLAEYRLSQVLLAALPISIAATGVVELLPESPTPPLLPKASVLVLPAVESTSAPAPGATWQWDHMIGALTVLALAVGVFELGRLGVNAVALGRVRDLVAPTTTPSLQKELKRLRDRLNVRRSVRVCAAATTAVPVTLGGRQPVILVPERLTESPDAFRMTLRHELVHIRRWDDVAQFVERIVAAVFAVHPLVGRLRRRIDQARERACDAAVLDDGQTPAGDYARLLATFADGSGPRRLGALSLSESPSSLKDRLSAMNSSIPSLLSSRTALVATLLAGGLALTLGVVACSDSVAPSTSPEAPTATESSATTDDEEVFMVVEDPPELVGGMEALQEAVSYPEMAKEAGIEGRAIVQFVVDENGNVTDPTVTRGAHELLNEAAIEAVKEQEFNPGKQRGEPVKVQMSIPVTFRLPDDDSSSTSTSQLGSKRQVNSATAGLDAIKHYNTEGDPSDIASLSRKTRVRLHEAVTYPALARKAGMEGRVLVRFTVNDRGQAENPQVENHQNVPDLLSKAALQAVKDVTHTPEYQSDNLAGKEIGIRFEFLLPDDSS
jgi:TonB family protein